MSNESKELSRVGDSISEVGESITRIGKFLRHVDRIVTSVGSIKTGIGVAAAGVGALWSRTNVAEIGPVVGVLVPMFAFFLIPVGLAPAVVSTWRWCMRFRPSVRFRRLVPQMRRLFIVDESLFQYESGDERLARMADEESLTVKLRDLGMTLPGGPLSRVNLMVLAEQGKLQWARKRFPLEDEYAHDDDLPF